MLQYNIMKYVELIFSNIWKVTDFIFNNALINFIFVDQGPGRQPARKQQESPFLKFMNQVNWKEDILRILIVR
jgi:hypothetical protein